MPRFGVLTHNPSSGNPYTDFVKADRDLGDVQDVFAHHLGVAEHWDEARKHSGLFKGGH